MVDFHSHVLPGMDDGAPDEKIAAEMLRMSRKQGVDLVVATPHYYHSSKDTEAFFERRDDSYNRLVAYLQHANAEVPKLIKGAEVKFSHELLKSDIIERFCIEGTNMLLLEMPFSCWNNWMFDLLFETASKKNIDFIIAHAERYVNGVRNFEKLRPLLDMNFTIQVNSDSVFNFAKRKIVKRLFEENKVHLIGSDMHNIGSRKTTMDKAFKFIIRKYGEDVLDEIISNEKSFIEMR